MLTRIERINKVEEAQELINEAIDLIEEAVKDTEHKSHTRAYIIDKLNIIVSENHGFLTRDTNLDELGESLRELED